MNILNPENTTHEIKIIPRYYPESAVIIMELFNEEKKTAKLYNIDTLVIDGYMYLRFTETFINNTNYQIRISEGNEIVYRGKLFITNQSHDTQNYKITKDVFTI